MRGWRWLLLLSLVVSGCAKHDAVMPEFTPVMQFSGRVLVMTNAKRFQLELDWQADAYGGSMRLTHGMSGRVIDVVWRGKQMRWRDNHQDGHWRALTEEALKDMGIPMPPWQMAKVFQGTLPDTMTTKDYRTWQGRWLGVPLRIRWADQQQRVELLDMKQGWRVVVIFS